MTPGWYHTWYLRLGAGNDVTVAFGAEAGQLELNVMEPVIIYKLFSSLVDGAGVGRDGVGITGAHWLHWDFRWLEGWSMVDVELLRPWLYWNGWNE